VALAGLDPREHQSGTSVRKKPHLSKAGKRYLRVALYRPALSAARHNPHVRGDYQHLIENRGLNGLIHSIYGREANRTCSGTEYLPAYRPTGWGR